MIEFKIQVEGMKCGMCESHINKVVRSVNGVKKVSSSHSKKLVIVIAEDNTNMEAIIQSITSQGYTVGVIDTAPYVKRGFFGKNK